MKNDYKFVAECHHVTNASNSKHYYFYIPLESQNSIFKSWNKGPFVDDNCYSRLLNGCTVGISFTDSNIFGLVNGAYVNSLSVVKIDKIIRDDHCSEEPRLPIVCAVDYEAQYNKDVRKKRINTIIGAMRKKKNEFVKSKLIDWLVQNDTEAKSLVEEYKNITGNEFKF